MAYQEASFELKDIAGSSIIYSGSASGGLSLPASADKFISEFILHNTGVLDLSINLGGTNFVLEKKCHLIWSPKNTKQIHISGSTNYQAIINYENCGA